MKYHLIIILLLEFFSSALADGLSLESKGQQVTWRTLLSILTNLSNDVVCIVSNSSDFSCSTAFQFPSKVKVLILFFSLSFNFTLWSVGTVNSTVLFVVVVVVVVVVRTGRLTEISRSVCISKSQKSLCISICRTDSGLPFVHMVKYQFLSLFLLDHLAHVVVCSLIIFLCWFAAFTHYVIDRFISFTTWPTWTVLLSRIYSCFDKVGPYGTVLCCYLSRFSFSLKVPLS